jgi:hypothetical protein
MHRKRRAGLGKLGKESLEKGLIASGPFSVLSGTNSTAYDV